MGRSYENAARLYDIRVGDWTSELDQPQEVGRPLLPQLTTQATVPEGTGPSDVGGLMAQLTVRTVVPAGYRRAPIRTELRGRPPASSCA
jgi:hypothetical protein